MMSRNLRFGPGIPDQPGNDWESRPKTVHGVASKPGVEEVLALEVLDAKQDSQFQVPDQGLAPSFSTIL